MSSQLGNINLFVKNVGQAAQFYVEVLGLSLDAERSMLPTFALLQAGSCTITLQDSTSPDALPNDQPCSIELGFAVDDLTAVRDRLIGRGQPASDVQQMGWGGGFNTSDPDGHRLTIYRMRSADQGN